MAATTPQGDALAAATDAIAAAGSGTARLDAEVLLAAAMGTDRVALYADPGRAVEPPAARAFAAMVRRRVGREPVAYILGRAYFRNLELAVDGRVLVPRPETELLVELARDGQRVLDIGTGSGAVALAIAHERAGVAVTGTDASPGAIEVARANATRLGLAAELLVADLVAGGPYDLIVSNPPYVTDAEWPGLAPEITRWEPREALLAGPDGLDVIRRLVPAAAAALAPGGQLGVEVGRGQSQAVEELLRRAGLGAVATVADLAGIPRVVTGRT